MNTLNTSLTNYYSNSVITKNNKSNFKSADINFGQKEHKKSVSNKDLASALIALTMVTTPSCSTINDALLASKFPLKQQTTIPVDKTEQAKENYANYLELVQLLEKEQNKNDISETEKYFLHKLKPADDNVKITTENLLGETIQNITIKHNAGPYEYKINYNYNKEKPEYCKGTINVTDKELDETKEYNIEIKRINSKKNESEQVFNFTVDGKSIVSVEKNNKCHPDAYAITIQNKENSEDKKNYIAKIENDAERGSALNIYNNQGKLVATQDIDNHFENTHNVVSGIASVLAILGFSLSVVSYLKDNCSNKE